jgi:hypothetical protein
MGFAKATALAVLALLIATMSTPPTADALKIDAGKWQFTTTSESPMVPIPHVETDTECITDEDRSIDDFMGNNEGCTVSDLVHTDAILSYKVSCPNGAMVMTGTANLKSTGKTLTGLMRMGMSMNGEEMTMDVKWEGKRLGPCD